MELVLENRFFKQEELENNNPTHSQIGLLKKNSK